jgi:hypothetical protein
MADEIEHARLAFGLASAYAGERLGPGPLDVETALEAATDARAILDGLIVEACVGETLAAIEAQEAAAHATDPVVASVCRRIAEDELRHAQLGWRSLRWLLDGADTPLRAHALATLDAAVHDVGRTPPRGLPIGLRRHGVLDDALRMQVRAKALESLVVPCVAALRERFAPSSAVAHA